MPNSTGRPAATAAPWTFLTNHSHVLLSISADPGIRMRDVAEKVGITERAVQRIVSDLEDAGYVQRVKAGRRNQYAVHANLPLRHPIERHRTIASLIGLIAETEPAPAPRRR